MGFFKKFTEQSPLLVAFLLSRFKASFFTSSGVTGLKSNILVTESVSEFSRDAIFKMLV